jgi:hypothetical protein
MRKKMNFAFILLLLFTFLFSDNKLDKSDIISPEEILEAVKSVKKDSLAAKTGFDEFVKDFEKIEGLFTFYKNIEDGSVYLEIKPEQFDEEFLCTITRQTGDAYFFDSSSMLWNFLFYFKKVNKRVQLIEKNLKFRADEPSMKRAIENCISNSIIASSKLSCKPHEQTGSILISASDLFLKDMVNVENKTGRWKKKFSFDKDNSYFSSLRSFPHNSEIEVVLHFYNSGGYDIYTLPDSRSMLHRYHYSISSLHESNYKPRLADDRIGMFTTIYQDYTSLLTDSPYIRYVNRWHLEKEAPEKKLSKVKNPIVFWLENTIPLKYRPAVRKGILLWNEAFEAIGLKDAIIVKEMPDSADWDPADSRYNTIRWIVQPGGGYAVGPSHVNPYTGEIYDADIRVSVDFLRFFFREYDEVVEPANWKKALNSAHWDSEDNSNLNFREIYPYSVWMNQQLSFAYSVLATRGIFGKGKPDLDGFVDEGIIDLVCHEVGHTLGLRHNFKGSTVYIEEQLQNKKFTEEYGITSSIMDYTPINLAPIDGKQGSYFQNQVGEWDKWVIEYGYSIFDTEEEKEKLEDIASRCTEPLYDYGTDEDTYGLSTRGVDPLCSMFDLGKDPLLFYETRIGIVKEIWENIFQNFEIEGESYKKLLMVFSQGLGEYHRAAHNSCKYIGGMYTHRDHIGDPGGRLPFEVVPADEQRRALNFLVENIFDEDAFYFSPELLNKLVYEKMGTFTGGIWSRERVDFPIHDCINDIHSVVISHLYDPLVLCRLLDNELKFQGKEEKFVMAEMFDNIRESIWDEVYDQRNINSFRRELQRIHLYRLSEIVLKDNNRLPNDAVALARADLIEIREKINSIDKTNLDRVTSVHLDDIYARIKSTLTAQKQLDN